LEAGESRIKRIARIRYRLTSQLRQEQKFFLVLTILIGALVGGVVVAFLVLTERLGDRFYPPEYPAWRRFAVPLLGSFITGWLLYRFFPDARGSGIPQTKVALFARGGRISLRTTIGKFVCCSASLASGIALGREGPSVQIGAGLASVIGRRLKLSTHQIQELVPVGASAALAAAFNTPIAAVLFTLEEVVGNMHAKVLGSVVLSAATSWVVLHLFLGNEPLFHVPAYQLTHNWEFGLYAVLGLFGGLVSAAFVKLLLWLRKYFFRMPPWSRPFHPAMGGFFVGALALALPEVLGTGYSIVGRALNGHLTPQTMLFLLALKLLAIVACYASGNAGGIFGPSLFLGAMLGGAVGHIAEIFLPNITGAPGAYALVGMGASFAGIIRTPFASVIMIFELTRDYNIIVPLMISNLISYAVSIQLQPRQVYQALAEQEGVHLPEGEVSEDVRDRRVLEAMEPSSHEAVPTATVEEVAANVTGDCIVAERDELWGVVSAMSIHAAIAAGTGSRPIAMLVRHPPGPNENLEAPEFAHLHPDHPLELALRRMGEFGVRLLPVVDRANPRKLLGQITLEDVLKAYRVS